MKLTKKTLILFAVMTALIATMIVTAVADTTPSLTYLNPVSTNLSSTPLEEYSGVTPLTFTRNNRPIVYTNYPEQIGANGKCMPFAEDGYCVNQQVITAGEAHVFFSHWNCKYRRESRTCTEF